MLKLLKLIIVVSLLIVTQVNAQQGGMWIPSLLEGMNEAEMKSLGCELTAKDIYDINNSSLKDAIGHFNGGCTSEIISPKGLILTNHHCGFGQIQSHSSLEKDYLKEGFWAKSLTEELPNKGLYVDFIVRIEDVTVSVLDSVLDTMTEEEKQVQIAKNIAAVKEAAKKEEKYKEGLRLLNELNAKSELSINNRLKYGLKLCCEFLGLEVGIVSKTWMDEYNVAVFWPEDCGLEENQKFVLGHTYCDITLRQKGKVLGIDDMASSEYKEHPCFKSFQLASYIGAAYRVNGKVAGTVNFTSKKARSEPFSAYEIDFITLVARWVGTLMELKESRNKLLEEQNLLKTFVSRAPAAIAMLDKHMNYISASEKWVVDQNIVGDIIGKSHYKVFPEIPKKWIKEHFPAR